MQWCRKHLASYKCPRYVVFARNPEDEHRQDPEIQATGVGKGALNPSCCAVTQAQPSAYPISDSFVRHLEEPMPDILISNEGPVRKIRMNRPDKKNALTLAMYEAMAASIEDAGQSDGVKCLIIAGAPDVFCAGNDLKDFVTMAGSGELGAPIVRFPACAGALWKAAGRCRERCCRGSWYNHAPALRSGDRQATTLFC